jgi:hypothetical protein
MAITHKYTLVCDDVRQENNGKFIVVGLYTGIMAVPQLPATLPFLTFFMFVEADRPGNFPFRMRLENMETGQRLVEGMGNMNVQKPGIGASPIRIGPLQFTNFGTYNFVVTIDGQEPIVTSFEVMFPPSQPLQIRQGQR